MSAYEATLSWLYALEAAKGMDFKLERVEAALHLLDDPHARFPCVHIGGTNGKGSTAAMVHAVLTCAGRRVGLYTSPHLVRFTERIRVGDSEISPDQVVDLVGEVRERITPHGVELTFFEITTVMALTHFARQAVDVAVLEVGLGGRLDATNVVDPLVSVVTTIGLDHERYLGHERTDIAREKGGIIKPRRPVVLGRIEGEERSVLTQIAAERQSPVYALGRDFELVDEGGGLSYHGIRGSVDGIAVGLRGAFQRDNAATALAAVELALPAGEGVPRAAMRSGIATVRWPGRLEIVEAEPMVVLDAAHNVAGVEALLCEVASLLRGRTVRLLFGVMRDKRWSAMARMLAELADDVTVTHVLPPRGESAEALAAAFSGLRPTRVVADPASAFLDVRARARRGDAVLVTGSIFLVGAVYPLARRPPMPLDSGVSGLH